MSGIERYQGSHSKRQLQHLEHGQHSIHIWFKLNAELITGSHEKLLNYLPTVMKVKNDFSESPDTPFKKHIANHAYCSLIAPAISNSIIVHYNGHSSVDEQQILFTLTH